MLDAARVAGSEILAGHPFAIAANLPLALPIAGSRLVERPVHPSILLPRIVAETAIAPLFVVCLGSVVCLGFAPELLLVFLLTLFPILGGAVAGFEALDSDVADLGRSRRTSARRPFLAIRRPQAPPVLFTGSEVGAALAAMAAAVADFVVSNRGLGDLLLDDDGNLETAMVYAVAILLSATGLALYRSVDFPEALHFSCWADSAGPANVFRKPEFRRAAGRGSGHVRRRPQATPPARIASVAAREKAAGTFSMPSRSAARILPPMKTSTGTNAVFRWRKRSIVAASTK